MMNKKKTDRHSEIDLRSFHLRQISPTKKEKLLVRKSMEYSKISKNSNKLKRSVTIISQSLSQLDKHYQNEKPHAPQNSGT
jgi:hypothetical protein